MRIAGIARVVYAAALADSARALAAVLPGKRRARDAEAPTGAGRIPARQALAAEAVAVLKARAQAPP